MKTMTNQLAKLSLEVNFKNCKQCCYSLNRITLNAHT